MTHRSPNDLEQPLTVAVLTDNSNNSRSILLISGKMAKQRGDYCHSGLPEISHTLREAVSALKIILD